MQHNMLPALGSKANTFGYNAGGTAITGSISGFNTAHTAGARSMWIPPVLPSFSGFELRILYIIARQCWQHFGR